MKFEPHWMPFTANRTFKENPRLVQSADGMYYQTSEGEQILDMAAGLWCSNLGHCRTEVAEAIAVAAKTLDYAPSFNMGHPTSFELAERLTNLAPGDLNHVFFTTSGSEAVDTALKIALAYQVMRGQGTRRMIISREKAYHGVNFGGTAVGGIQVNTRMFGRWTNVDFLPHTLDIKRNAFSRGLPEHGLEKADVLSDLIALHGAENIAAVIVEPIPGAGGMIPPPIGYLKRLRSICDEHDILLIFDEVVCGFGRVGAFMSCTEFGVIPDLITSAKGLTSGTVPMGAVFVRDDIYKTIVNSGAEGIEFWHGYTYSAHPLACAAALACLDVYEKEGLFTRARGDISTSLENALHSFRSANNVIDVRNYGMLGAIEFEAQSDSTSLGTQIVAAAWDNGLMVRGLGDTIVVSPPLIADDAHMDEFTEKLTQSIRSVIGGT